MAIETRIMDQIYKIHDLGIDIEAVVLEVDEWIEFGKELLAIDGTDISNYKEDGITSYGVKVVHVDSLNIVDRIDHDIRVSIKTSRSIEAFILDNEEWTEFIETCVERGMFYGNPDVGVTGRVLFNGHTIRRGEDMIVYDDCECYSRFDDFGSNLEGHPEYSCEKVQADNIRTTGANHEMGQLEWGTDVKTPRFHIDAVHPVLKREIFNNLNFLKFVSIIKDLMQSGYDKSDMIINITIPDSWSVKR